jgi:transposase-like protein
LARCFGFNPRSAPESRAFGKPSTRGGETAEEELKRLRREMTQLKQERDILKKSVAFFARDRS